MSREEWEKELRRREKKENSGLWAKNRRWKE